MRRLAVLLGVVLRGVALLVLLGSSFAACSAGSDEAVSPEASDPSATTVDFSQFPVLPAQTIVTTPPEPAVRIGAVMSKTGWLRAQDEVALVGIEAQVRLVNNLGGVIGLPLQLSVIDSQSDQNEAFQGGLRVGQDEVNGVFVSCDRNFAQPTIEGVASETADNGEAKAILTFVACQLSQDWGDADIFSFGITPEAEGRAMASYVLGRQYETAAIFTDRDSGYSQSVCREFQASFTQGGGRIVSNNTIQYVSDPSLFSAMARQQVLSQAQIIIVCSVLPTGQHLYNALRSAGNTTLVLAGTLMDGAWLEDNIRQGSLQVLSFGSVWGDDPSDEVNDLVREISRQNPDLSLDGRAVAAADAVMAFVRAAELSASDSLGNRRQADLREALGSLQGETLVSGAVSVDAESQQVSSRILRVIESSNNIAPRAVAITTAQ